MLTAVETKQLTKSYGMKYALQDVDLTVYEGDIFGLVGKNGAGKTTLFKLIQGITRPTDGQILLFGSKDRTKQRARIGALIETPHFYPYMSAEQNLEYFRIQRGIAEKDSVIEVLRLTGLMDERKKLFRAFSMGMKQRLGIALSLLGEPDLLLLDEPTNGIDPEGIVQIRSLLRKLNRERHITILISSHILSELAHIANRYAIMDAGLILDTVTREELDASMRSAIRIRTDSPERVVVILEEVFSLSDFRVENDKDVLLYESFGSIPEIIRALVVSGIRVYDVHRLEAQLEDYFLQKVGGDHV
ncbi:MAG: ABC transporter ATP-binding protein [Tissierellia bacterium]|jgi:ABC-2 type transport system ATP-binding protein|nr:ABC transporter ATP-binding protein [Bacillota bacterium]NLK57714.1 ABC transporter ATP-binding protein [Tissierellia bacterium]